MSWPRSVQPAVVVGVAVVVVGAVVVVVAATVVVGGEVVVGVSGAAAGSSSVGLAHALRISAITTVVVRQSIIR